MYRLRNWLIGISHSPLMKKFEFCQYIIQEKIKCSLYVSYHRIREAVWPRPGAKVEKISFLTIIFTALFFYEKDNKRMHALLLLIGIDTLILFPAVPVALWGVLLSNKYRTKCHRKTLKREVSGNGFQPLF